MNFCCILYSKTIKCQQLYLLKYPLLSISICRLNIFYLVLWRLEQILRENYQKFPHCSVCASSVLWQTFALCITSELKYDSPASLPVHDSPLRQFS